MENKQIVKIDVGSIFGFRDETLTVVAINKTSCNEPILRFNDGDFVYAKNILPALGLDDDKPIKRINHILATEIEDVRVVGVDDKVVLKVGDILTTSEHFTKEHDFRIIYIDNEKVFRKKYPKENTFGSPDLGEQNCIKPFYSVLFLGRFVKLVVL